MSIIEYENALRNIKQNNSLSLTEKSKQIVALNELYKSFNGHSINSYV